MKYYIALLFAFCLLVAGAQEAEKKASQSLEQSQVPAAVLDAFARQHPGNTGTWSKEGENYRVEFIDRNSRLAQAIVYDSKGNIVRRDSELEIVPEEISEYYNRNFPGESFKTWSSEGDNGDRYYYSKRQSEALRFDREGNYIKPENKAFTPPKQ